MGRKGNQGYIGIDRRTAAGTGYEQGIIGQQGFYLERLANDRPYYIPYKSSYVTDWQRMGVSQSFTGNGGVYLDPESNNTYPLYFDNNSVYTKTAISNQDIKLKNLPSNVVK